jgi:F-type H+-transporting ATPase subunit delta
MGESIIAKRYSKGLCQAVGDTSLLDKTYEELKSIQSLFDASENLRSLFNNPAIHLELKKNILNKLLHLENPSILVANFTRLLLAKNRIKYLNEITKMFEILVNEAQGRITMKITTAFKLDKIEEDLIREKFERVTGKKIFVNLESQADIIGGVIVKIGDTVFDGSIRNQLNNIKDSLDREGGVENKS